jgi:hypothetical protein
MPALSNDPARCEVMNLAWGPNGHGPYLVRQEGYEPGSSTFKAQRFILQKDGRWLMNLAFVMLPEAEQEAQLFHSLTDVARFLDAMTATPMRADTKLPEEVSEAEILQHFEQCTHRILRGMRSCAVSPLGRV